MDATRSLRNLLAGSAVFFGSVIALGALTAPNDATGGTTTRPEVSGYTHDELQRAADMTQQMSAPSANTGSQAHTDDEQLVRSHDSPGYVRAVELHQADIDRMLARDVP